MGTVVQQVGTAALTAAAPAPSINQPTHEYNRVFWILCNKTSFAGRVDELLAEGLSGCGTVDLVSIDLVFKTTAAAQSIKAGICEAGASIDLNLLAMKTNGINFTSTSFNAGTRVTETIVPEDTLSTQIRPIPSDRPAISLKFERSKDVDLMLGIKVRVLGIVQTYMTLN